MFLRLSVGLRKGTRMQRMNYLIFLIVFLCCKTYASNAILHKEKCHFCLNYSLTFAFRSYSGPNCATNKKNEVFVAFERKKPSMLINWLAFYIDCVWQCAKSDKREKEGDRFEFERNNVSNNAVNGLGHCVYRSNQEKKHSHFHLCIPRRQTIRDKHVTVTVTVFFHSWQQQKKIWRKKERCEFFSSFDFKGKLLKTATVQSKKKDTIKLPEKRNETNGR